MNNDIFKNRKIMRDNMKDTNTSFQKLNMTSYIVLPQFVKNGINSMVNNESADPTSSSYNRNRKLMIHTSGSSAVLKSSSAFSLYNRGWLKSGEKWWGVQRDKVEDEHTDEDHGDSEEHCTNECVHHNEFIFDIDGDDDAMFVPLSLNMNMMLRETKKDEDLAKTPDIRLKLIVLGDSFVGKSTFLQSIADEHVVLGQFMTTIGIDFRGVRFIDEKTGNLICANVWDTAGQERFRSIISTYYTDVCCALLFYDVSQRASFDNIREYWLPHLKDHTGDRGMLVVLVANKTDSSFEAVRDEEAITFSKKNNLVFIKNSNVDREITINNIYYVIRSILEKKDELNISCGIHYPKRDANLQYISELNEHVDGVQGVIRRSEVSVGSGASDCIQLNDVENVNDSAYIVLDDGNSEREKDKNCCNVS